MDRTLRQPRVSLAFSEMKLRTPNATVTKHEENAVIDAATGGLIEPFSHCRCRDVETRSYSSASLVVRGVAIERIARARTASCNHRSGHPLPDWSTSRSGRRSISGYRWRAPSRAGRSSSARPPSRVALPNTFGSLTGQLPSGAASSSREGGPPFVRTVTSRRHLQTVSIFVLDRG